MFKRRRKHFLFGLMTVVLAQSITLTGCGSNDSQSAVDQPPPKNQLEGLNRLRAGNIKHDETAPVNQKALVTQRR